MSEEDKTEDVGSNDTPAAFDWTPHVEPDTDISKLPQSPDALAKEYMGLRTLTGKQATKLEGAVFIPGEDATPEDRDAFYAKLGRPEKAGDYGIEPPEGGGDFGKSAYNAMQNAAHKAGLSKGQLDTFHKEYLASMKEAGGDLEAAQGKLGEELKTLWGDNYSAVQEDFNRAVNRVLGSEGAVEFSDLLVQSGMIQANPAGAAKFMDMTRQIIAARKEGGAPPTGEGGGGSGSGSAREQLNRFRSENTEKMQKKDPTAIAEWQRLTKLVAEEERK